MLVGRDPILAPAVENQIDADVYFHAAHGSSSALIARITWSGSYLPLSGLHQPGHRSGAFHPLWLVFPDVDPFDDR